LIDLIESYWDYGERKERTGHYPSEITDCPRKVVMSWNLTPKSNPIKRGDWWKIQIGNAIHNLVQSVMESISADPGIIKDLAWPGFNCESEVRSGDVNHPRLTHPIRYRLDLLFTDQDQKIAGMELKTAFGRGMSEIKNNGPKNSAVMQAVAYIMLSGIDRFYLPIVSRDNADRVQFVLDKAEGGFVLGRTMPGGDYKPMLRIPETVWDRAIDRLAEIEQHVQNKTLPNRPYIVAIKNGEIRPDGFTKNKVMYRGDWQCHYCPYMEHCWKPLVEELRDGDNADWFQARDEQNNIDSEALETAVSTPEKNAPVLVAEKKRNRSLL
jgi:hypothetical protein